eukprot:727766_1
MWQKNIKSNGLWQTTYGIPKHRLLSISHLIALTFYTCLYESKVYCQTLLDANPQRIAAIAVWCRLLTECVQCYGTELDSQTKYYRGIDCVLLFEQFVSRFNLPTTTSRNLLQASRFAQGDRGFIFSLCKYGRYNVLKFDCDRLSAFSDEKETLFFGGETVLKILSIHQHVGQWRNYKKYMKPINIINR